jgi:cobalt-zinc-cadmium efflux system protein
VVGQLAFGLVARSLGLVADAGHNLSDVAAVVASLVAVRWARRAPTAERSYGYHRGTILAALANAAAVLAVTGFIFYEGALRLAHPEPVRGGVVVLVALVAFGVNAGAAVLLHEPGVDLNMRSALLHMAGDALASLGVALAGLVILLSGGLEWLDPLVSMAIGALIAVEAFLLVRQAAEVLLESTPKDVDLLRLTAVMGDVDGVEDVHDLHVWSLSSEVRALSAHVVLTGHPSLEEAQVVGDRVKTAVAGPFAIAHSTLELECEPCVDGDCGPCGMDAAPPATAPRRHSHG